MVVLSNIFSQYMSHWMFEVECLISHASNILKNPLHLFSNILKYSKIILKYLCIFYIYFKSMFAWQMNLVRC